MVSKVCQSTTGFLLFDVFLSLNFFYINVQANSVIPDEMPRCDISSGQTLSNCHSSLVHKRLNFYVEKSRNLEGLFKYRQISFDKPFSRKVQPIKKY